MDYTEEQLDKLEQEEYFLTEQAIVAMLILLSKTKSSLEKELRAFYQKYGADGIVTYREARKWVSGKDKRKRLNVLLLFISDEFNKLSIKLPPKFETMLFEIIGKEQDFFDTTINEDKVINASWGVDDKTWFERLDEDIALWSVYLANDIKQAILKRKHIDDLIKQIDKRFYSMENVLEKLGVTESTAIGSMARQKIFKELGVSKYQFFTRADERTCEVCGSLHGLIFPMSAYEVGVTASPVHPRCRCWEIPIRE